MLRWLRVKVLAAFSVLKVAQLNNSLMEALLEGGLRVRSRFPPMTVRVRPKVRIGGGALGIAAPVIAALRLVGLSFLVPEAVGG